MPFQRKGLNVEKEQSTKEMLLSAGSKVDGVSAADIQKLAAEFEREYNANQQRRITAKAIEEMAVGLAVVKYRLATGEPMPALPNEEQLAEVRDIAIDAISRLAK